MRTPSLFSNVRRRTDQIDAFTTETSCLTIVWAVMQDIRLPKIPVGLKLNAHCGRRQSNQPFRLVWEEVAFAGGPV
jgi:hypothetical protein